MGLNHKFSSNINWVAKIRCIRLMSHGILADVKCAQCHGFGLWSPDDFRRSWRSAGDEINFIQCLLSCIGGGGGGGGGVVQSFYHKKGSTWD